MAKQYDRLLNPFIGTTKQDVIAFDDDLWRLKVALDRVQRIIPFQMTRRQYTISKVLKQRDSLASMICNWRNMSINNDKKSFHLGTLQKAVEKLEDMVDDMEYMQLEQLKAFSLTRRSALVLKLRTTEELLQYLHCIVKDFQEEFKLESDGAIIAESETRSEVQDAGDFISKDGNGRKSIISEEKHMNQRTVLSSEVKCLNEITEDNTYLYEDNGDSYFVSGFDSQHDIKEQLLIRLLEQRGDLVIAYDVAQGTEKATIPVHNIFHDKRVREKFELLLCVRSSDRPMSNVSRQITMTESILQLMNSGAVNIEEGLLPEDGSSNWSQGEEVKERQKFIKDNIYDKKFLLVLYDVTEDQLPQLDDLLSALSFGSPESKIVISSQSSEVLQCVRGIKISEKRKIQHNIFWFFFRSFAFCGVEPSEPELEQMGKEMAMHLKKFPLAAKMVAKMLKRKHNRQFWTTISGKLRSMMKSVECEQHQLISLLKMCYNELPAPLRLCFQYCSLFPKNWTFTSESLVQIWMSQGLLTSVEKEGTEDLENSFSNKVKIIENVGESYFRELCSRSFFEKLGHTSFYSMHCFVLCLAQVTAGEEFMRIESDFRLPDKSKLVRHLSVKTTNLSALYNVDALFRLRTLIIFGPIKSNTSKILMNILPRLKKTRALDLAGCDMNRFPGLTNELRKHLRYLSIYDTGFDSLPDKFGKFLHLQVLNIQGSRLEELPQGMTRLCNLRHFTGPTFLTSAISHIGKLKALQELEEFQVSKMLKISQLGSITDLGGSITITNLEKVKCADAAKARLQDKRNVHSLKLEWSSTLNSRSSICGCNMIPNKSQMSAKILERLQPHSALRFLEINGYIGGKSPSWFTSKVLQNIVDIRLRNCMNWDEPPPLGQLARLKTLKLENWNKLRHFGKGLYVISDASATAVNFPELDEISLEDMPELGSWEDCSDSFPCLQLLTIRSCPNLEMLPVFRSSKLAEIYVEGVGIENLSLVSREQEDPSTSSRADLKIFESLTRLTIKDCPKLLTVGAKYKDASYLPTSLLYLQITGCQIIQHIWLKAPASLQELRIERCRQLTTMNVQGDYDLPSLHTVHVDTISLVEPLYKCLICLKELMIKDGAIVSLEDLPKSLFGTLKKLSLIKCDKFVALPENMREFSSLKSLCLKQCDKIKSLPYLPYNLDELRIDECPLLEERCREDGPDWSNICHVPYKYI